MHPATQANINRLQSFGNIQIAPQIGELASGLTGAGRLEEPEAILQILINYFNQSVSLTGKNILITAGPTYEAIDPVRYISNHSSGKMGFALAAEAFRRGANVTLITGPTELVTENPNILRVDVITASQMADACNVLFDKADITIMAAAVADYKPVRSAEHKIKKSEKELTIELEPTLDILKNLGSRKTGKQFLAGFALETENEEHNALKKLREKNLDLIVLNSPSSEGSGFGHDTNKITIFIKSGEKMEFTLKSKQQVASDILDTIFRCLNM